MNPVPLSILLGLTAAFGMVEPAFWFRLVALGLALALISAGLLSSTAHLGRPGPFGYTVRVVPRHPLLASIAEMGLVTLPEAPAGMTNGDLR